MPPGDPICLLSNIIGTGANRSILGGCGLEARYVEHLQFAQVLNFYRKKEKMTRYAN